MIFGNIFKFTCLVALHFAIILGACQLDRRIDLGNGVFLSVDDPRYALIKDNGDIVFYGAVLGAWELDAGRFLIAFIPLVVEKYSRKDSDYSTYFPALNNKGSLAYATIDVGAKRIRRVDSRPNFNDSTVKFISDELESASLVFRSIPDGYVKIGEKSGFILSGWEMSTPE